MIIVIRKRQTEYTFEHMTTNIIDFDSCPDSQGCYALNQLPAFNFEALKPWTAVFGLYPARNFTGSYQPNPDNDMISVNFRDLCEEKLATRIPSTDVYSQSDHTKWFYVKWDDGKDSVTVQFLVSNALLKSEDRLNVWAWNHFLTNQQEVKHITKDSPEWLTYYDPNKSLRVVARVYPKNGNPIDVAITNGHSGVTSVNVSCRKIQSLLSSSMQLNGYYDIMLLNGNTVRATQHYVIHKATGTEKYFLFVNALGGIDTLICRGDNILQPEITFNTGRLGNRRMALDDTEDIRVWQQNMRFEWRQRNWVLELLKRKQAAAIYNPKTKTTEEIVVTGIDFTAGDRERLATASFTYMMADADDFPSTLQNESKASIDQRSIETADSIAIEPEVDENPINIGIDYTDLIANGILTFESLGEEGRIHLEGSGEITIEIGVDGENFVTYEHDAAFENGVAVIPVTLFVGDWVRITADTLTCVIVNYNTTE